MENEEVTSIPGTFNVISEPPIKAGTEVGFWGNGTFSRGKIISYNAADSAYLINCCDLPVDLWVYKEDVWLIKNNFGGEK